MPVPESIADRVNRWASEEDGVNYILLHTQIEFLARHLFSEYEPTSGPAPDFLLRCRDWVAGAPDESDQKLLVRLVPELLFLTGAQFRTLYRMALNETIVPWLIAELNLFVDDPATPHTLASAIRRTWFCGVTDSMQIAAFYHANNLKGINHRPDWRSLAEFGSPARIQKYMRANKLDRIVLLEDFVGSGSQLEDAARFVGKLPWQPRVLIVPLVTCPGGCKTGQLAEKTYPSVAFSPVLSLPPSALVTKDPLPDEPELITRLRYLATKLAPQLLGSDPSKKLNPLGFRSTGALVVMYTNCPNNTLPLIHHRSDQWSPLFPRSARL